MVVAGDSALGGRGATGIRRQRLREGSSDARQGDAVLGPFRPGQARLHRPEVQRQHLGEHRRRRCGVLPQPLGAGIGLDQRNTILVAAGQPQVRQRLAVDRKKATGRPVLRGHVGDGRTVGQGQLAKAGAKELDEFADDAMGAQLLGHGQHKIGRGRALAQAAGQRKSDHVRHQHRHRLPQHRRLGLDAADAPTQHRQAVDHRRMAVGADQRIGIRGPLSVHLRTPDHLRQMLQIDLVANAGARWNDAEIVERLLPPAQEFVPLAVAAHFQLDIAGERIRRARRIDTDRMVDDQIDRRQRIDALRIAPQRRHRVAHRRQIDNRRHAGKVLHQHPHRTKSDFGPAVVAPRRDGAEVVLAGAAAVAGTQLVLQQHAETARHPRQIAEALRGGIDAVVRIGPAAGRKRAAIVRDYPVRHFASLD